MNTIRLLVALLLLPSSTHQVDCRKVVKQAMPSSVLIHVIGYAVDKEGKDHKLGIGCSGTYIRSDVILTAAHCFQDYTPVKIFVRGPADKVGYKAVVVAQDVGKDLALLVVKGKHQYALLGPDPALGEDIVNIGSPMGFEFVVSQGVTALLAQRSKPFTGLYTVTTAFADHGSSGGGCFNMNGQLVGVNTLILGFFGWAGLSMAVNRQTIDQFLKENSIWLN